MIRKNKLTLVLTSVIILLPVLFGLAVWNELPAEMATHWGADGTPNGWSARSFAVIGIPFIILALHWFCILCTHFDKRNRAQSGKLMWLVLWICPAVALFFGAVMYAHALGGALNVTTLACLFCGLLVLAMGNYLPKCRPSHTIGIRTRRTLADDGNWTATHRFTGRVWVISGLLMLLCTLLPSSTAMWVMAALLVVIFASPLLFSWRYHAKAAQ